ncbi:pimeloyl-ACP methyl ester carboxylesterase [Paenibacillus taihuensis]|uniref:Pimeloyl-ACP methyl ester carboxylesterase n=1 Tax=Paenibacillus taihuensis TaxID=1156355 RepID=A0A3D9SM40_9BACL|nr:alpha/beta hydrolase [Paenibacillus taihuensis]REE91659.1 pimeloyl-ACP methyl ester carboxylesterase [Paenibacillus taihuensis]
MEVQYKKMNVEGTEVFFREAGNPRNPAIILLHGFPSSSHMFRDLIPLLADCYYVIAPDYPGYGNSSMPSLDEFSYTFEHLSLVIEQLINGLCIPQYILYCHDYGGPVGFRLAIRHPERVLGFVIQNAVAHAEGLGQPFDLFKALWADPSPENKAAFAALVDVHFTKKQYTYGACDLFRISPDGYIMDQCFLDRPGNAAIQLALGYDYRNNVEQYPRWQQYLRTYQPPTLIAWGKNDFIFTLEGAYSLARELTCVELVLLCGGHFVLEEESFTVARLIKSFFCRVYGF